MKSATRATVSLAVAAALVSVLSACSLNEHASAAGASPPPSMTSDAPSTTPPLSEPTTAPNTPPVTTTRPPATKPPGPGGSGNIKNVGIVTGTGPAGSARSTGSKAVALTFDDGPDPTYTPRILDLLKKNGVKATFCLVGFRARDYPQLVQRIVAEGHTLCNHSWQHKLTLGKENAGAILSDLKATNNAIHKAVPDAKIAYFRAPGGNFTPLLVRQAKSLGMKSIYWAVDTRDWDFAHYGHGTSMTNHIISSVKSSTQPGAIVLSHDLGKPDTINAYKVLLPWLKARFTLIALPT